MNARNGVEQRLHAGRRRVAAGADRRVAVHVGVAESRRLLVLPFAIRCLVQNDLAFFALDADRLHDADRIAGAIEDEISRPEVADIANEIGRRVRLRIVLEQIVQRRATNRGRRLRVLRRGDVDHGVIAERHLAEIDDGVLISRAEPHADGRLIEPKLRQVTSQIDILRLFASIEQIVDEVFDLHRIDAADVRLFQLPAIFIDAGEDDPALSRQFALDDDARDILRLKVRLLEAGEQQPFLAGFRPGEEREGRDREQHREHAEHDVRRLEIHRINITALAD